MSQDGGQGRYAGGSVAGGRYQLRDLLGEGGMASVYLAYDSALDRQVAIKTLHTELGREQSFRERFRREAQAVAKLSHPNIVSVFDTGEDTVFHGDSAAGDGALMPYIVMEYVEGQPLGSVLQADIERYGAMPADKALKITSDVLAALETSHEMGLVHRDIKPGNVMMTKRDVVKVMDFGIARAMQSGVTSMTQTGMVVGTPQYLSPEQALGRGVDARSDLYSVGIMLFQLVTGRLPFDADSPLAIAYAHVQEEPVAPSSINRSIPPAVDALVARALKKNPNERFPSAAAMRDECARVSGSGQAGAAPVIVAGGPSQSGSGVGSAVFPPVEQAGFPQSGSVQAPYQPTPGPYGPPTPAPGPAQPAYGYPTPAPYATHNMQQGTQTPPPYTMAPQGAAPGGGGGNRNMPVLVGAIAVVLLALGGVITAISLKEDDPEGGSQGTDDPTQSEVAAKPGYRGPDRTRTMKTTDCSPGRESATDPDKVEVPSFLYKDLRSVKLCLQAANWKIKETRVDDPSWGEDLVVNQYPKRGSDIDPDDATIELEISTGNPPSD
ncbi:serine/threonine protein kinase [Streptomyces agglomeratus]|uniref:non-specific serine/threonine protein kinase n=1 Tax=Streptomyces agglomeratus TaxID=285458 RepID=A0A1E5P8W0_9ACTN|nr:protein kinase [Streptomyces agglomeratus]OEJ25970.1 serine/threonine protein kinase [Streptomyces agglomeratus]OEJ39975.1 serine/threonine protein kinase [Streptomyces agglomeratus]OEJ45644.1 serine/threonine protein kinase [Streptomyces agglomeratus]OEJ52523.1 serine/threonine protein kinase [Streptomyces agglomeratus]OEJ59894.1 serine/threonine protein kinase [Streptomyces agglomeratus]